MGWQDAYVSELRNPQGSGRVSGEWTRTQATPAEAWQQAISGYHNPIPTGGGPSGGGGRDEGRESHQQESQERRERAEAEELLRQARGIDREIAGLRQQLAHVQHELRQAHQAATQAAGGTSGQTPAPGQAPGAQTGGTQAPTAGQTAGATGGTARAPSVSSLKTRQSALESQIRGLQQRAAKLRREAAALFAEAKTVEPVLVKVSYAGLGETVTFTVSELAALLGAGK